MRSTIQVLLFWECSVFVDFVIFLGICSNSWIFGCKFMLIYSSSSVFCSFLYKMVKWVLFFGPYIFLQIFGKKISTKICQGIRKIAVLKCQLFQKISIFDQYFSLWHYSPFSIFDEIFDFWPNFCFFLPNFRFLTKFSIFDLIFDFWPNFRFLT